MPEVVKYLPENINHETELHVRPNDTYFKELCKQSVNSSALRDYPHREHLKMIKLEKNCLMDIFGCEPRVFVAGKWSVNSDTIKALIKEGFTHDCSASQRKKFSYCDWSKMM